MKITIAQAKNIVDDFIGKTQTVKDQRESNFNKYQKFGLEGKQWSGIEKPEGKSVAIAFNQTEDFLETYIAKLFPRSTQTGVLEIGVKIFGQTKSDKDKFENEILETYDREKLPQTLLEQAQNFFYGGDACIYYPRDDKNPKKAKIISLDPQKCYLGWNGNVISQFAFEDEVAMVDIVEDVKTSWIKTAIDKYITKKDEARKFEKVKRITYWDNENQIIKVGNEITIYENKDGFIPFSWIPNNPKAHSHEGISEVRKIIELEQAYNQRGSDFGERVRKNTKAKQVLLTDKKTGDLDKDQMDEGIIKLGQGDDAKLLTLTESPEILKFLDVLDKRMSNKMAMNNAVQGEIKSNVSSLAMMYYFSPLLDRIGLKRIFWDEAFRELNRAILLYAFDIKAIRLNPVYQPVLMTDTETKIKNTIMMVENHLMSYQDAIDELRGSENSIEKFEEIKKEFEELSKIKGFLKINKTTQTTENQK